ncbi:hypothetical protein QC761_000690 [Podospora bellae-mahoneyi]|uniref:Thioesterase family protein n=1 Tax=Podospora bellae-mahoneyi TaxID=2093777 RepID=A0ABR0FMJ7_9PEZI|nr:hypothetical protein QC761_000690 [Podospora bellae-mahoneyi]
MSALIPFSQATKVERLDSHTYKTNLLDSYCIGTVPNGGYSASCLLEAARLHLASKHQKDAMTSHFQFLNRTEVGPAIIIISETKPGRQFSMLHLTLYQRGLLDQAPWITKGTSRAEITAYLTMTDLSREQGLTLPTLQDDNWRELNLGASGAFGTYARVLDNCHFYFPKWGQEHPTVIDLWMRFKIPSEGFTNSSLGLVSDAFPYVVEAFRPPPGGETDKPFKATEMFWYPTIVMSLELKRSLPEEKGVEWLRLRMQSKEIRNGRLDLEVVIRDEKDELIGVSNQVNLILGSERNTGGREIGKI